MVWDFSRKLRDKSQSRAQQLELLNVFRANNDQNGQTIGLCVDRPSLSLLSSVRDVEEEEGEPEILVVHSLLSVVLWPFFRGCGGG